MEPYAPDHELATRARALENHLPHLYANAVGTIGGVGFVGGSRSVGPSGEVLAEAGAGEALLVAPVGAAGTGDESIDYLGQLPGPLPVVARLIWPAARRDNPSASTRRNEHGGQHCLKRPRRPQPLPAPARSCSSASRRDSCAT